MVLISQLIITMSSLKINDCQHLATGCCYEDLCKKARIPIECMIYGILFITTIKLTDISILLQIAL